ncbi:MAG: hypothetical protein L0331_25180 [Chloroflexi bacterium]|nr:hypothetical protein [Chloroflexota bacterium]
MRVLHEGNVAPWLMAAEAVVHNSCTTGVEGYLLDRPVVAYRPVSSEQFDMYLPNALSYQVFAVEELCDVLRTHVAGDNDGFLLSKDGSKIEVVQKYISGLEGSLASERIVRKLQELTVESQMTGSFTRLKANRIFRGTKKEMKMLLSRTLKGGSGSGYKKQKFPKLELADVIQAVTKLQTTSGRFFQVTVQQVDKSLFHLYQKS